ncbi:type IV toxin-antitoxin system AbiEi family antitoxin [Massilia oculi]|uniref:type IV toxin-antitoxin system AbiEi family antitoxin n=1 Tax=Massilia oculi TaxID=945844 RepID=UPI001AAF4F30|nr:type IV toxin-antitoxin system AbiEi family antitoxin [Massilia oculi]
MNDRAFSYNLPDAKESLMLAALDALAEKIGIRGSIVELETVSSARYQPDAAIDLAYEGGSAHYAVECKFLVDRKAHVDQVRRQLETADGPALLIAPYITKELAVHCRATGLQFIDTNGNAYLQAPGLFVLITGEKNERKQQSLPAPKGLTSTAALRVVFVLLAKPDSIHLPYKELARHAGVSLGTAHNVLNDLERRGYLINKGDSERRRLLEPERLVDEWAINYPTTLRTKLNSRRFSAPESSWWQAADLQGIDAAWGSEVAAAKLTGHLKPATQTLYVRPGDMDGAIKILSKQHRIRPDHNGNIEILEKFWHWEQAPTPDIAPPLLVYSELLGLLDPRTQETARMLKEKFIDASYDQS